jgi:hypothetical protein
MLKRVSQYSGKMPEQVSVDMVFRFILLQDFLLDGRNDTQPPPPFCRPSTPHDAGTFKRYNRARELMLLVWPKLRGTVQYLDTWKYST